MSSNLVAAAGRSVQECMPSLSPVPGVSTPWSTPDSPMSSPARERSSSRSPPPASTGPISANARATIRRPRVPPRCPAWRSPESSGHWGTGSATGRWVTGCAPCCPVVATPLSPWPRPANSCPCRTPSISWMPRGSPRRSRRCGRMCSSPRGCDRERPSSCTGARAASAPSPSSSPVHSAASSP
jgi:hypothetical protein